jgi:septum formation protein
MMTQPMPKLILASSSPTRQKILRQAGITFEVAPANLDEEALLERLQADQVSARDCADALAAAKAKKISHRFPEAYVLGADQTLALAEKTKTEKEKIMAKPASKAEARAQLLALSGQVHVLHSALVIAHQGQPIWRVVEAARLRMRLFSEDFLDAYLDKLEPSVINTPGVYQLEGLGAQLFEHVDGDYFTILGLPLWPLLRYLRLLKVVQS